MERFRRKPIEVEATKFMGPISYDEMCVDWGSDFVEASAMKNGILCLGTTYPEIGDYIVHCGHGIFVVEKPHIFKIKYELMG